MVYINQVETLSCFDIDETLMFSNSLATFRPLYLMLWSSFKNRRNWLPSSLRCIVMLHSCSSKGNFRRLKTHSYLIRYLWLAWRWAPVPFHNLSSYSWRCSSGKGADVEFTNNLLLFKFWWTFPMKALSWIMWLSGFQTSRASLEGTNALVALGKLA